MALKIHNPSSEPVTLPFPLTGVLKGGQSIVLVSAPASLIALVCVPALQVSLVSDLAGDDARYYPWPEGFPGSFLADGAVTPPKLGGAVGDEAVSGGLLGNMLVLRRNFAAGEGGAADDVEVTEGLGFGALLVDVILHVTTGVADATVTLRDQTGGAGNALSDAMAAATESIARSGQVAEVLVTGTTPLYLRRSDTGVAGFVDLVLLRA